MRVLRRRFTRVPRACRTPAAPLPNLLRRRVRPARDCAVQRNDLDERLLRLTWDAHELALSQFLKTQSGAARSRESAGGARREGRGGRIGGSRVRWEGRGRGLASQDPSYSFGVAKCSLVH